MSEAVLCRRDLALAPALAPALAALGVLLAIPAWLRRALAAAPDLVAARIDLAALDPDPATAGRRLCEALALAPEEPSAWFNLALAQGRTARAAVFYRRSLAGRPEIDALSNLADLVREGASLVDSIPLYRRALALEPDHRDALNFLAVALLEEGALAEATTVIGRAAVRHPGNAAVHFNAGVIAQATGDMAAARASSRRALALDPDNLFYRRGALATALYDPDTGEAERAEAHRAFGARATALAGAQPPPHPLADPARRLRVGLLSSDFRDHPVARNLEPLLVHHDRSAFELSLYGEVPAPDETTRRLRSHIGHWRPIVGLSDREVADRIRADNIDILVFLAGRFDGNRPEIAAWRAAPIQISLHDPGTSGMPAIDYLIADRRLVPRRGEEWFAERVLALPTFFLHPPIPSAPPAGPLPLNSGHGVTFGSFNHPAKVNDRVLALWARLLREVSGSRLILKYRGYFAEAPVRQRVERAAAAAGVDPKRFVLLGQREDREAHLNRYRDIDIALDPFPFSGSTTTFEALWMGVPVVTAPGANMASRWSAAMLRALGCDAWIARSPESYIGVAADLARDAKHLGDIRDDLRRRVAQSALCDGVKRTRQLERLMRALWRRWCAAQATPPGG